MKNIDHTQFISLFQSSTCSIDVRAPIEFASGSIPGSINLPLLTDSERHQVGLTYKQRGQDAAIVMGNELVSGTIRKEREDAWIEALRSHPDSVIYCFRGGLRSQTVQKWLSERSVNRPIIEGGYKAVRNFLLESLSSLAQSLEFQVVSGPTGSGKTSYLKNSGKPFLDLEAIAKHRGSVFGKLTEPQPSQADFENLIAVELLRLSKRPGPILVESESRSIGRCYINEVLLKKIQTSPKIVLEIGLEERVKNIFKEYVLDSALGTQEDLAVFDSFSNSVRAISRKLGGQRTQEILEEIDACKSEFEKTRDLSANISWIRKLLVWYYDPSYKYSEERASP